MATQAKVTSTDALENFRASLIIFRGKAKKSVDEVTEQVSRTRMWLQHDQRTHWEGELRRNRKILQQAEQEMSSARLTSHNESAMMARQAMVNKAKRAITEAEDKLRRIKNWIQNYDSKVDPLAKRLESLRNYLDTDVPRAIGYLANAQKILEDYARSPGPIIESASTPAPETAVEPGATP
jgi:chromosome segregation ATPase